MGLERPENLVAGTGLLARGVDVLDAQQPLSLIAVRFEVARNGGEQRAEMQRAGW